MANKNEYKESEFDKAKCKVCINDKCKLCSRSDKFSLPWDEDLFIPNRKERQGNGKYWIVGDNAFFAISYKHALRKSEKLNNKDNEY